MMFSFFKFHTRKKMDILVGSTGFVGSNLANQKKFDELFCSKNISNAFGTLPELCVYAGVRAEKYLANQNPEEDRILIENAIMNIKKINPKKLILISTVDIFKRPKGVEEMTPVDTIDLHPYGLNRLYLENWVVKNINNCHIIRLPALFGKYIKKNFIYDLINRIPVMLTETKFVELRQQNQDISNYYLKDKNGFYRCKELTGYQKKKLECLLKELHFSSLNFTDSRASFSFYNLKYLWQHINIAVENNIKLIHLATEPIAAGEIHQEVYGRDFINEIGTFFPEYDIKSKYAELFGGRNGYIFDKETILYDIKNFIGEQDK